MDANVCLPAEQRFDLLTLEWRRAVPSRHFPLNPLMSLFFLREGYRVVTTRTGARVVHVRTGGSIDLSSEEVLLFARATAGGVDASDPKLRNLVRRFVALGVLVSATPAAGGEQAPAQAEAPSAATPTVLLKGPPQDASAVPGLAAVPSVAPQDASPAPGVLAPPSVVLQDPSSLGSALAIGPSAPQHGSRGPGVPPLPSTASQDAGFAGAAAPTAPAAPTQTVGPRPPAVAASTTTFSRPTLKPAAPADLRSQQKAPLTSEPARAPTLVAFSITGLAPPAAAPKERDSAPIARPAGSPINGEETARLMRADLNIARRPSSSLLDVSDPRTGKTFPLYDFELSLARMLDGRRLYREVVEAGQRLGIPVDLQGLGQFVSQLERYGFLAPSGTTPSEVGEEQTTWAPRRKWDDGLRALFQSGLRMHRQGRYAEAANYFEAMLQQDLDNPEATDMLEQCRIRLGSGIQPTAEPILAPPDSGQVSLEKLFFAETSEEEAVPELPAPRSEALPERPPDSLQASSGVRSAERARAPQKRRRWPVVAGIVVGSLIAAGMVTWYLLGPKPQADAKVAVKTPAVSVRPKSAAGLTDAGSPLVASAKAAGGASVGTTPTFAGGETRAPSMETKPQLAEQSPAVASEKIAAQHAPAVAQDAGTRERAAAQAAVASSTPPIAPAASAQPRSEQNVATPATAGVNAASARAEVTPQWLDAKLEKRGRVTMAEVTAPGSGRLSWTASATQRVRRGETLGSLRDARPARERQIRAPKEGLLIPKAGEDDAVSYGQPIASIVYPEAYLQASLADARPHPGWACEVYQPDSSERAACKIIEVVRRGSKSLVTATTEPLWFDSAREAVVRLSPPR